MNINHIILYIREIGSPYRSVSASLHIDQLRLGYLPMGDPLLITTTIDTVLEPEVSMLGP